MDALSKGEGSKLAISHAHALWYTLPTTPSAQQTLLLRPLAESGLKEIHWYIHHHQLDFLLPRDLAQSPLLTSAEKAGGQVHSGHKASLERLTENFIYALEANVSSTVNTIGRTGSKLVLKSDAEPHQGTKPGVETIGPSMKLATRASTHASVSTVSKVVDGIRAIPSFPAPGAQVRLCPFCCLPAQEQDARDWKNRISIRQPHGAAPQIRLRTSHDSVDLSATLCYSCILVLDVAPDDRTTAQTLDLPIHVRRAWEAATMRSDQMSILDGASAALAHAGKDLLDADPAEAAETVTNAQAPSTRQVARKLQPSEMREQFDEFLLE